MKKIDLKLSWIDAFVFSLLTASVIRGASFIHRMTSGYHPVLQWSLIILFAVTVEGGYLFAHYKLERESTTRSQNVLAGVLAWLCFLAAGFVAITESLIASPFIDFDYLISQSSWEWFAFSVSLLPVVMMFVVIALVKIYQNAGSASQLAAMQREMKHEQSAIEIEVYRQALDGVLNQKDKVSQKMQPHIIAELLDTVEGRLSERHIRTAKRLNTQAKKAQLEPTVKTIPATWLNVDNGNGQRVKAPKVRGGGK